MHFRFWLLNALALTLTLLLLVACAGRSVDQPSASAVGRGHLLIIGGGLDDDNKPVYQRFIALAQQAAGSPSPRIVIATAASGDQEANAQGKRQSILAYCPSCGVDVIRRETTEKETVALIDGASAMFFTGGDQKRITDRYLKDGADTPEAVAMRRLLTRGLGSGGVIAGTSAGDAMMSDPMFLTGRSAEALGIRSTRTAAAADDDPDTKKPATELPLGPQIGKGMGFLSWAITDSHFFERHRFGRLVAALEASGVRLGIGVGEDACVEVELATGELTGVSVADSLLVDAAGVVREGLTRRGVRAAVVRQGSRFSLAELSKRRVGSPTTKPAAIDVVPVVEPGQNRQLASWRFFLKAQNTAGRAQTIDLDGYRQTAWPAGANEPGFSIVEIEPL